MVRSALLAMLDSLAGGRLETVQAVFSGRDRDAGRRWLCGGAGLEKCPMAALKRIRVVSSMTWPARGQSVGESVAATSGGDQPLKVQESKYLCEGSRRSLVISCRNFSSVKVVGRDISALREVRSGPEASDSRRCQAVAAGREGAIGTVTQHGGQSHNAESLTRVD